VRSWRFAGVTDNLVKEMPKKSPTSPRKPGAPNTHGPARSQIHANWVVYFYEVVRCGSVRAAARKLNVAPSAISRQIKDLESQLGTQLLEKTSTRLRPTSAGEAVARHASNVIKDLSYTRAVVADLNGLRRGHVSIVAAQATSTDFLPHAISELKRRFPRVSFNCEFTGTANVVPRLIDGTADVGVAFQPPSDSRIRNVISVPLPFGIVVHADHELAGRTIVRLSDFENELVILPDHSISYRMVLDRMIEGRSFQFQSTVTSSEPTFIVSLVRYGAGIAFGTPVGVERELKEGSLVFIPLQDRHLKPPALTVSVTADRALSPLASVVVERFRNDAALLLRHFVPDNSEGVS
jgi:DNA-binding transcriptional LysR family regulator